MLNISEYIDLTDDIVSEILALPVCQRYKQLQQKINSDPEIINLISEFDQAKAAYAEVERYGSKYHPDYKSVSSELVKAKTNLFEHQDIKEFKTCEKEVQEILDQITFSMRDAIKFEPNGKSSSGCKGDCSH